MSEVEKKKSALRSCLAEHWKLEEESLEEMGNEKNTHGEGQKETVFTLRRGL